MNSLCRPSHLCGQRLDRAVKRDDRATALIGNGLELPGQPIHQIVRCEHDAVNNPALSVVARPPSVLCSDRLDDLSDLGEVDLRIRHGA